MRLVRTEVHRFGCIDVAEVDWAPGLNLAYGPNDIGKSTLASALRAVLLMQATSSAARAFRCWAGPGDPRVVLTFEVDGIRWRVDKTWRETRGQALLERADLRGGWSAVEEGRAVDGRVRELLGWGVPAPGGKGGTRGLPRSFLSTVLLADQAQPYGLLGQSLSEDASGEGKERLTEALQALATDPLYEEVLERTRAKVSEAFTDNGRRRTARTSPFVLVAEEVRERQEREQSWVRRLEESDAVAQRWAEADASRSRWGADLDEARARLERVAAARERQRARAEALADRDRARAAVEEIDEVRHAIAESIAQETHWTEVASQAREALERGRERAVQCRERLGPAEARVRELAGDGEGVHRERVRGLQAQREAAHAARERIETRLARLRELQARERRVAEAEADLERETARARALEVERADLEGAVAEVETELDGVRRAEARDRWERARRAVALAEQARSQANDQRARAVTLRADAEALRAQVAQAGRPTDETLERVIEVDRELQLARAAMGGGLRGRVDLLAGTVATVLADGAPGSLPEFEAAAEVELTIPNIGVVRVYSGHAEGRAAFGRARAAWDRDVAPWLERCGEASVASLLAAGRDDARALERARLLESDARTCERIAATHDREASQDASGEAELRTAEEALLRAGGDPASCEASSEEARAPEDLAGARARGEARLAALRDQRADLERTRNEANAAVAVARAKVDLERAEVRALQEGVGELPDRVRSELEAAADRARADLERIERDLAERMAEVEDASQSAKVDLEAARATAAEAEAGVLRASETLEHAQGMLSERRGARAAREDQLARIDEVGARATLERCEARLAEFGESGDPLELDDEFAAAQRAVEEIERNLEAALEEVRKQEGALQHVGGAVVRERAEAAREAVEAARRHEAEVELEYEAWSLLLRTLREVENEEGTHLGRALGPYIGERFAALTRGRYGEIVLGPELDVRGLRAHGELREVGLLSEGLKEQLATILRVAVAEHLRGTLVLDDHLAQTDPTRVVWFRDLLESTAPKVQLVLLTCRPSDYLRDTPRPGPEQVYLDVHEHLRVIDLARAIRRA